MIYQSAFEEVVYMFDRALFFVPTFQRPFSWKFDKEVERLIADVESSQARNALHYLAPMHLIKIDTMNSAEVNLSPFGRTF